MVNVSPSAVQVSKGDAVVVYSTATGRVRRFLVPGADGQIDAKPMTGEAFLKVAGGGDLNTLQAAVNAQTGKTPSKDRYVMIDQKTGAIVGACIADMSIDKPIPGVDLVQHDTADGTWTYVAGVFVAPVVVPGPPKK